MLKKGANLQQEKSQTIDTQNLLQERGGAKPLSAGGAKYSHGDLEVTRTVIGTAAALTPTRVCYLEFTIFR